MFAHHANIVRTIAAFGFLFLWHAPTAALDTPAARVYRTLTDVCLDRYLSDKDLNEAQMNTARPLIVHCDCIARFLFFFMDREAVQQLETRIPDKIASNWSDAVSKCSALLAR